MRFGLFGGARTTTDGIASDSQMYLDFIDYVCEAERLGFSSLFLVEHHFTGVGQISASMGLLNYLAAKTTYMRLGTAVVVLPWHNPALLVEQAATLDLLSNGRFDFGIGRGYRKNEFQGFCIPMEEANDRFEETLAFIKTAWTTPGRFSHRGKFWSFDDVVIEPAPVQKPHPPLWVGAGSARSIEDAAQRGFNILLSQHGTAADVGKKIEIYRQALAAAGRPYRPYSIGLTRALHVVMNRQERERAHELRNKFLQNVQDLANKGAQAGGGFFHSYESTDEMIKATEAEALIGDPEEITERLNAYKEVGVDYILTIDVSGSREGLRTFGQAVLPRFSSNQPELARATSA